MHPFCLVPMQNASRHRWRFPVPNACNAWRPMKQMASPFQGASGAVSVRIPVVIPYLNQPALRDRGLRSLHRGAHRPDEITILAMGAPICPGAVCGASPDVRLLPERESGPGPARTKGGAESSGDVPAFMDADCLPDRDWVHRAPRMRHHIRYVAAMKACHPACETFSRMWKTGCRHGAQTQVTAREALGTARQLCSSTTINGRLQAGKGYGPDVWI
jgi:hypothetical protein